jgi:5-methylcytosine-specific restriction protein A
MRSGTGATDAPSASAAACVEPCRSDVKPDLKPARRSASVPHHTTELNPVKVCNEPGCPQLTDTGRCPTHSTKPWAGSTRRQALPPDWPKRRRYVLHERDQGRCYLCGQPGATEVDHVKPIAEGGTSHLDNLAAVHPTCHATKTAAEATRGKARRLRRAREAEQHPGLRW